MAVLGKIRQRSALIIVVIGLAMFAFLLPELLQNGFNINANNVGSINGKDILFEEFRQKVDALEKSGQGMTNLQAVNRVWEQEINVALLSEEFEKLGLRVGDSHILETFKNDPNFGQNPMFQNEAGVFDVEKLKEFFRSNPEQRFFLENKEKDAEINAKYQIYNTLLRSGVYVTLNDAQFKHEIQNSKVNFDFVTLPYSSVNDSEVTVSDQEIIDYMKKNEKKYKAEESREIEYVLIEDKATEEDKEELENEIKLLLEPQVKFVAETKSYDTIPGFKATKNVIEFVNTHSEFPYDSTYIAKSDLPAQHAEQLYNLNEGEIYGPYVYGDYYAISRSMGKRAGAKARASHILISYDGTQVPNQKEFRTKEEAKAKAQELLTEVQKNPDNFKNLATQNSDDSNGQQGGDLGFFNPGDMVKPFDDFVFNNPVGKIGLVETDFGFHIISITDKQDAIRLATIAKKIEASEETADEAYNKALKFEMDADSKPFADVANSMKLQIAAPVTVKAFDERVSDLGSQRQIIRWAFEKKTSVNDVKRFDIVDKGYVVVRLKKINEEGLQPVSEARLTVEPILKNKKKAEILKGKINGDNLESIASANNVTVQKATDVTIENPVVSGAGFEPKVVGMAFATETGKVSKTIEGNSGVYILKTQSVNKAVPAQDYSAQINTLKSQGASATSKIFTVLKDKAKIKDNRAKFNY